MKNIVYLGLGSNIYNRFKYILNAIIEIQNNRNIDVLKISSFYKSNSYGRQDQDHFINICIEAKTNLTPQKLLKEIKLVEKKVGRIKRSKWSKREIDIDILFYNKLIINEKNLIIPHYDFPNRSFFILPMIELNSRFTHPILKVPIKNLFKNLKDDLNIEKIV